MGEVAFTLDGEVVIRDCVGCLVGEVFDVGDEDEGSDVSILDHL